MAQQVKIFAAKPKDLSSIPAREKKRRRRRWPRIPAPTSSSSQFPITPIIGDLMPSDLYGHLLAHGAHKLIKSCAYTHIRAHKLKQYIMVFEP